MSPPACAVSRRFFRLLAGAALLSGVAACDPEGAGPPPPPVVETVPAAPAPVQAAPVPGGPAGPGFRVAYAPLRGPRYAPWERYARDTGFLERIADDLNGWLALPTDVTLVFAQCGEANAFYEPETQRITLCYELLETLGEVFADDGPERDRALRGAATFIFYHELGHALIHVLDLPALGREEDSADQLAAYVLTDGSEEGERAALDGAVALGRIDAEFDDLAFADEHSLGVQRFYNVACWVYGRDPAAHARFLERGTLPPERAERCPAEYAALERSWDRLLEPYAR